MRPSPEVRVHALLAAKGSRDEKTTLSLLNCISLQPLVVSVQLSVNVTFVVFVQA